MLEPGEVVINRKAVAAMGGAQKANKINKMIPRFAAGGEMAVDTRRTEASERAPPMWSASTAASAGSQPVDCSARSPTSYMQPAALGADGSGALMTRASPAPRAGEPLVVYADPAIR